MMTHFRRGNFELLLCLVLLSLAVITAISLFQGGLGSTPSTVSSKLVSAYHELFERIRADCKVAMTAKVSSTTLELIDGDGKTITYRLTSGKLMRHSSTGITQTLFSNLENGGFAIDPSNPKLISVWLVPSEAYAFPFFTSFALRGGLW